MNNKATTQNNAAGVILRKVSASVTTLTTKTSRKAFADELKRFAADVPVTLIKLVMNESITSGVCSRGNYENVSTYVWHGQKATRSTFAAEQFLREMRTRAPT